MGYTVEFTSHARRQFSKLDPQLRRRVVAALERLEDDPRPRGIKKLAGHDEVYRLRVGSYRVLYEVDDGAILVLVFRIGHRREVYRR